MLPRVSVLRVGHRLGRDPRLTTHVALAARAFGAERLFLHPPDVELARRIESVSHRFGGAFRVEGVADYRKLIRTFSGTVVHLTMYGESLARVLPSLQKSPEILLVVGGPKVPPELFQLSELNVAVGNQPHSEVAAVAVVLEQLRGIPEPGSWPGARQRIVPTKRGKRVVHSRSPT